MKQHLTTILILLTVLSLLTSCSLKPQESPMMPNPKFEGTPLPPEQESPGEHQEPQSSDSTVTVTIDQLKNYMNQSYGMMEFAQRFFSNYIIYKSQDGNYTYVPVNKELPPSDYDFSNLVNVGTKKVKELEYVVDGETVSLKGIDVSAYQGDIEWDKVAASGVEFVFIRLGYRGYSSGKLVLDEKFLQNAQGAAENGIGVGVYFVTQAITEEEALEEAEFVLENIQGLDITWPIALDMEEAASAEARTTLLTSTQRTDHAIAFCERIKEAGHTPMLYTHIRWYLEEVQLERLTAYDKWFAQYFNQPFFPYAFQIWQYSSSGSIDGIKGNVDYNISFVSYADKEASNE
ncbi:MAG: hypothetical protein HUJ80_07860 [Firmicutes bacterium]|nr:hypothetical protein [Bacillota bacterium]